MIAPLSTGKDSQRENITTKQALLYALTIIKQEIQSKSHFKQSFFKRLLNIILTLEDGHLSKQDISCLAEIGSSICLLSDKDFFRLIDGFIWHIEHPYLRSDLTIAFNTIRSQRNLALGLILLTPMLAPLGVKLYQRYFGFESNFNIEQKPIVVDDAFLFGVITFLCERIGFIPGCITNKLRPLCEHGQFWLVEPAMKGVARAGDTIKAGINFLRNKFIT